MIKKTATIVLALSIFLGSAGIAGASTGSDKAALKAADYLKSIQRDDGGFGTRESTVVDTCIAVIALKAAGAKLPQSKTGKSTVDYLKANASKLADPDKNIAVQNTAKVAQLIMALKLAGENPKTFAGTDWIKFLLDNQEKATGWFGITDIDHMWAMLALEAAGEPIDSGPIIWLKGRQNANGGYEVDRSVGMGAFTYSTALAIQALVGAGVDQSDPSVKKAVVYLKTQQNTDGGFPVITPSSYGSESDASSTSWVLQGLVAAGEDIESKTWLRAAITPMGFLMSMQNANGAFAYQKAIPEDSLLCTAQAIPALMLKPFPIKTTPPPSTAETLPLEDASFSTEGLLLIIIGAIAAIAVVAGLGFVLFKRLRD
ncbi:MAG: prenyltransferase/squalene oxidase repeat-containing protein [Actinomycetota bacterium]